MYSLRLLGGGLITAALCLPVMAAAQDVPIGGFRQCGGIGQEPARLACFDAALANAEQELQSEEPKKLQNFGLSERQLQSNKEREKRVDQRIKAKPQAKFDPAPTSINAKLIELFSDGAGRRLFLLENGQLWRETSNSNFSGRIRAGDVVKIQKGTLSGYRLVISKQPGFFGVRRVR